MRHVRLGGAGLAAVVATVVGCGGPGAPPYDPRQNPGRDAGAQGGRVDAGGGGAGNGANQGDGGLLIGSPIVGAAGSPEAPDDFVSQWATLGDADQICAGWHHSCGIREDGHIACWGRNHVGQLDAPQDETFVAIGCGDNNTCGITEDGRILCWGTNDFGQLEAPTDGVYTEVDCGEVHCCAIDEAQHITCWGAGGPDGNRMPPDYAQASPPAGSFRGITTGKAHSCAIEVDSDRVRCWGAYGQTGDCFPPRSAQCGQANAPPGTFTQVAAGFTHSCAIDTAGALVCWGQGRTTGSCDPYSGAVDYACGQAAPLDGTFEKVTAGDFHTCVIDDALELHCQGRAASIGNPPPGTYSQVSGGAEHSCAIRRNGVPVCFGNASDGQTSIRNFP